MKPFLFFTFLFSVSLCMAQNLTLSGKVTNTAGAPIAGASVKLNDHQVTSGADGSFSFAGATGIHNGEGLSSLIKKSEIKISNDKLYLQLRSQTNISVAAFSLKGETLFQIHDELSPGKHTLDLPQKNLGVQVYKVKLGEREFLVKGFSSGGQSIHTLNMSPNNSSAQSFRRTGSSRISFPDVITANATGYIPGHVAVSSSDASNIEIKLTPGDCADLPNLSVNYETIGGPASSEDFEFDNGGSIVSLDNSDLFKTSMTGSPQLILPNVVAHASGTAILPNGDIVIADAAEGIVVRVTPNGGKEVIGSNILYPNGVTVDLHGFVYVSDQELGNIVRINPEAKEQTVVASGLLNPNGVSFSPDYRYLYVVSFGWGTVHRMEFDENRNPVGEPILYANEFPIAGDGGYESGSFDGVGVDACGNVYVTEFGPSIVWVVKTNKQIENVVDLSKETDWIPNLHWGSGIGGWERDKLYVIDRNDNQVFALDVGVSGKPMPQF